MSLARSEGVKNTLLPITTAKNKINTDEKLAPRQILNLMQASGYNTEKRQAEDHSQNSWRHKMVTVSIVGCMTDP